jgi:hypothetical protein
MTVKMQKVVGPVYKIGQRVTPDGRIEPGTVTEVRMIGPVRLGRHNEPQRYQLVKVAYDGGGRSQGPSYTLALLP